jgi:hypothetical protein
MTPLPHLLLATIVGGHIWLIAAHARAWLVSRSRAQYARSTFGFLLSLLIFVAAYLQLPPAALLIIGGEATLGALGVYLTNSIRTPWCGDLPRDILLLRTSRRPRTEGTICADTPPEPIAPPMMRGISPAK